MEAPSGDQRMTEEGAPSFGAGASPLTKVGYFAAQVQLLWSRWGHSVAQVVPTFGAGVILEGGPAPQNGILCAVVAQVPPLFPHLRQQPSTPAPAIRDTCATRASDRRHRHITPAPTTIATRTSNPTPAPSAFCLFHQHGLPSLHLMNLARNLCNGPLHSPYNQPLTLSAPENKKSETTQSR